MNEQRDVVILSGVRTAIGDYGGSLKDIPPSELASRVVKEAVSRAKIDPKDVKMVNLGEMPNRALTLKTGTIDAAMLSVPYDLYLEKDGFRPIAYLKDISEFPLLGLIAHDERMRDKPDEVKKILVSALRGIAYTKTHREEVLPLLKQFVGLPTVDMTRTTYEIIKELWPDNGIPSDKGLATALSMADVPPTFPAEKVVDWSLVTAAAGSLKFR